jgi:hypothetical protein
VPIARRLTAPTNDPNIARLDPGTGLESMHRIAVLLKAKRARIFLKKVSFP